MAKLRLLLKHLIVGREFESNFGSKCDGRQMNVCVCAHTFVRFNSILPWRPHHKCVYFPFPVKPPAVLARGAWVFYDILVPLPFGFLTPSLMLPYPPTTTIPLTHPEVISNDCKLFIQIHQSSAITLPRRSPQPKRSAGCSLFTSVAFLTSRIFRCQLAVIYGSRWTVNIK